MVKQQRRKAAKTGLCGLICGCTGEDNQTAIPLSEDARDDEDGAGWLLKRGGAGKMVWQRRFVVIKGSRLYYYKDKTRSEVLGTIWLIGGSIRENKEDSAVTIIMTPPANANGKIKSRVLCGETRAQNALWLETLQTLSKSLKEQGSFCGFLWFKATKKWKRRWAVLDSGSKHLFMFKEPSDEEEKERYAMLSGSVEKDTGKKGRIGSLKESFPFILKLAGSDEIKFAAESKREEMDWRRTLRTVLGQSIVEGQSGPLGRSSSANSSSSFRESDTASDGAASPKSPKGKKNGKSTKKSRSKRGLSHELDDDRDSLAGTENPMHVTTPTTVRGMSSHAFETNSGEGTGEAEPTSAKAASDANESGSSWSVSRSSRGMEEGEGEDAHLSEKTGEHGLRYSGYLLKKGGGTRLAGRRNWKRRWFELAFDERGGVLKYYADEGGELKGDVELHGCELRIVHGAKYKHQFTVSTPASEKGDKRSFMLRAESLEDYQAWRTNISTAIIESSHSMASLSSDTASSPRKLANPMFDKKL